MGRARDRGPVDLPRCNQVVPGFVAMNLGHPPGEDKPSFARSPPAIFPERPTQNPRHPFGPQHALITHAADRQHHHPAPKACR